MLLDGSVSLEITGVPGVPIWVNAERVYSNQSIDLQPGSVWLLGSLRNSFAVGDGHDCFDALIQSCRQVRILYQVTPIIGLTESNEYQWLITD